MKILAVAPRLPFPPDKGDRLTVFHLLRFLSQRHRIALACFCEPEQDERLVEKIGAFCERIEVVKLRRRRAFYNCATGLLGRVPLQIRYYMDPSMRDAVRRLVEEFQPDLLYAHLIRSGPYIEAHRDLPRVVASQVSMTLNYERLAAFASNPIRKLFYSLELEKLRRFEGDFVAGFDRALYISRHDVAAVASSRPLENVVLLPHGVDFEHFAPDPTLEKEPRSVIMTGNMGYAPNVDAAVYLCEQVLPLVRARHPDVAVSLVGADPSAAVRALAKIPGVRVTGCVADLRAHLQRAEIAVAPMRVAAGLQNKVLEGMAVGLPMVITPVANEAIRAIDGEHALVAREPWRFADCVSRLLEDPDERARIGVRARQLMVRSWSWETHLVRLERLFEELVRSSSIH